MPTLVIIGAQWGDEAKGKMVDLLGAQAQMVVRYSGGNNAGHTVIVGEDEFKFHLIPAGILHPHVTAVLGGGMVICPKGLLQELEATKAKRSELGTLKISPAAHVVFPYHRLLDALEETARGANSIGTTSRGIGPAYQDKVARFGIRMGEFVDEKIFPDRLREVLAVKNQLLQMFGHEPLAFEPLFEEYQNYAAQLKPYVCETDALVYEAVSSDHKVLFEGAQGTFLDLDSGTYPYVTSSHPISGGACLGTGVGPRDIDSVLGVCKAYTTRVGSGPFPTELDNELGEKIRVKGKEYGTTTGRGRRCGWLDLPLLRSAARLNSLSGWILTRLDVLSGMGELQVATSYRANGKTWDVMPQQTPDVAAAEPQYVNMPGWDEDISGATSLDDLPPTARAYLEFMEEQTGIPVAILSVGPERNQTIIVRPDLLWGLLS